MTKGIKLYRMKRKTAHILGRRWWWGYKGGRDGNDNREQGSDAKGSIITDHKENSVRRCLTPRLVLSLHWAMFWPPKSSLLYLPWADSCLIFPSARWILAQLLSISICAKVKSLQDLGLNMCCQATAPVDPLNPTRFEPTWTASCGDVSEGEAGGDGGRQVQPSQIVEPWFPAPSVIKSSPFCLTLWP